jgi:hypothetical protein
MTLLPELMDRWFVNATDLNGFPPRARFHGSKILLYADGNLIERLIDGASIMGGFYTQVPEVNRSKDTSQC